MRIGHALRKRALEHRAAELDEDRIGMLANIDGEAHTLLAPPIPNERASNKFVSQTICYTNNYPNSVCAGQGRGESLPKQGAGPVRALTFFDAAALRTKRSGAESYASRPALRSTPAERSSRIPGQAPTP
jgi:hypothetical protein